VRNLTCVRNLKSILICGGLLGVAASAQQAPKDGPGDFVAPKTRNLSVVPVSPATQPQPARSASGAACDAVNNGTYKTCREAAVAALRAGNDAANNVRPNRERATGFYLLSIQRDPSYSRALFNLGVMCVKSVPERWDEALKFYREASQVEPNPDLATILAKEIPRVEAIVRLETTPEGRRQRRFDLDLNDLIGTFNDPAVAVLAAAKLIAFDPGRWEGPAAAGILQAALGHYNESVASLDAAARLAPTEVRAKLASAAELARNEAQYLKALQEGDAAFEKRDYESAGRLYADAWQASPARVNTGMQAAVSFLMADRVPLAVQILARIHQLKSPELSQKAGLMLKELAAISPDAKVAADAGSSGDVDSVFDVAERIRTVVGDLRTDEIRLVTGPAPSPVGDDTKFLQLNDDELNHPRDEYVTTSESLFDIYVKRLGDRRVQPPEGVAAAAAESVAAPASEPPTAAPPVTRPQPFGSRTDSGAAPPN
jgi:tetratricopeptide (TPR) repeat protein